VPACQPQAPLASDPGVTEAGIDVDYSLERGTPRAPDVVGAEHAGELGPAPRGLLVGLMVASLTPTLHAELARLGLTLPADQGGYYEVTGLPWPLLLMVLDEVSESERDELLGAFGHRRIESLEARVWWQRQTGEAMAKLKEMPGYEELELKFIESLSPEQRLAGLAPEQRLAGLTAEEALLAMPDEVLRGLSGEYVATLSSGVREAIGRRLAPRKARAPKPGTPTTRPKRR
jgi:hypothetical protein